MDIDTVETENEDNNAQEEKSEFQTISDNNHPKHTFVIAIEKIEGKPFSCAFCDKIFLEEKYLDAHVLMMHEGHIAEQNIRTTPFNSQIKNKEKPFSCSYCEYKSYKLGNLKGYERTYTGDKPFICSTCGKTFSEEKEERKERN